MTITRRQTSSVEARSKIIKKISKIDQTTQLMHMHNVLLKNNTIQLQLIASYYLTNQKVFSTYVGYSGDQRLESGKTASC